MKTILVPTDFSESAHIGLKTAIQLARHTQAKVLVLHVLEPPHISKTSQESVFTDQELEGKYMKYLQEIADLKLKSELEKLHCEVPIEHEASLGNLFEVMNKYLMQETVAFVVSGTHTMSTWQGQWSESNTEKLVRYAPCPILAVKQELTALPIAEMVFATNLKDVEERTIQQLKYFQEVFASKLRVLYVNTPSNFQTQRQITELHDKFHAKAKLKDYSFHVYADDNAEDGILHYMEDEKCDLLALATNQRTGVAKWLSGSIAENLVNRAQFPILTFGLKHGK
ncbi:MAG: universal stress protein [Bacteroidetes bacterium]|nr:MAG: universal stress protein [Bacteroidota bacterium]